MASRRRALRLDLASLARLAPLAVLALSCLACGEAGDRNDRGGTDGKDRRPNVLFICVDDLRPDLGCYSSLDEAVGMHTPHMDRLAAGGLRFTSAWCQQALCNPSRASFLTGCRPLTTGVTDLKTNFREALPDVQTLPQWFRTHGYHTRAIGKIEHGNLIDPASWSVPSSRPDRSLIYALPENKAINRPRQKGPPTESADVPDNAYRDGIVGDLAVAALADPPAAPFFLALGFHKPHLPFAAPRRYWDLHPVETIDLAPNPSAPEGAPAVALHGSEELRNYHGVPAQGPLSDELARELVRGYRACVSYVDAQIGRVLDALEGSGLADETLVVLFGDHGYYLGEHGLWAKMGLFDDAMAVPLIVRAPGPGDGPGSTGGRTTDAMVELVDLYPTLADLCGLPLPDHLEGVSFAPLVRGDAAPLSWKRATFGVHTHPRTLGRTLRTPRYRLNSWSSTGPARPGQTVVQFGGYELYDHRTDPGENRNVSSEPAHARARAELAALLAGGWKQALPVGSGAR